MICKHVLFIGYVEYTIIIATRMTLLVAFLFAAIIFSTTTALLSHSGGLDSQGCHGGSKPYHCHRSASEMVPSSSGGNRLRCSAGSRSKDCVTPPQNYQPPKKKPVSAPKNGYVYGDEWYCQDGFKADRRNKKCIRD